MAEEVKQAIEMSTTIITASAGLAGVLLGSAISSIVSWKMKTKELQLKFVEQIFQKRIDAYETLLSFIQVMRSTMPTGKIDQKGYAITPLAIYCNKNQHESFQNQLYLLLNLKCHFLNYEIYTELYYLQTLEVNVSNYFIEKNSQKWEEMSLLIKADYIKAADRLNNYALTFFEKEIYNVKIRTNRGDYKKIQRAINDYMQNSDFNKNLMTLKEYL